MFHIVSHPLYALCAVTIFSKLVFMGVSFGCAADAIVMAAALSSQDPFSMPSRLFKVDENEYHRDLAASLKNREFFDAGTYSQVTLLIHTFAPAFVLCSDQLLTNQAFVFHLIVIF